jgi:hypothetical protein
VTFSLFPFSISFGSLAGPSGPAFLYRTFAWGGAGGRGPPGLLHSLGGVGLG